MYDGLWDLKHKYKCNEISNKNFYGKITDRFEDNCEGKTNGVSNLQNFRQEI